MKKQKVIAYPCPICLKRNINSKIKRQENNSFLCGKCGSSLNERQVLNKLSRLHDLRIADIYIHEINSRFELDFKPAIEGTDPPDATSTDEKGVELKIEITKYAPNFWSELLSKGSISGDVNPIQWLLDALRKKMEKNYSPELKKDLVLLLEGNLIVDDYFKQNEVHFTSLSFNMNALKQVGFKEIWYVSVKTNRAFKIY